MKVILRGTSVLTRTHAYERVPREISRKSSFASLAYVDFFAEIRPFKTSEVFKSDARLLSATGNTSIANNIVVRSRGALDTSPFENDDELE